MPLPRSKLASFAAAAMAAAAGGFSCSSPAGALACDGGAPEAAPGAAPGASAPTLAALSVSPAAGPGGSVLVPAFSPSVHDYYVRCPADPIQLVVSMAASAGATSSLSRPVAAGQRPSQSVTVTVSPNQAIVAAATDCHATTEYWVRCLPPDMPPLTWEAHPDVGVPTPGYYLVGNMFSPSGEGGYALMLDGNGVPVWYARVADGLDVVDVDEVVPGTLSYVPLSHTDADEPFNIQRLAAPSTGSITHPGYTTDIHELVLLPSGHYLGFTDVVRVGVDLTGLDLPLPGGKVMPLGPGSAVRDCVILEFTAAGKVVNEWAASDHFDYVKDSTAPEIAPRGASAPGGGPLYDPFHCNSIDVDPAGGGLLVSARDMDSVFYVAWPSGKVLWKMGGAAFSKDGARYVSMADPFYRQHDARFQPGWSTSCNGGEGQISVFDDRSLTPGPARAAVYAVVVGPATAGGGRTGCAPGGGASPGQTPGTAALVWRYEGMAPSSAAGSFRISADGSRVVDWGFGGAPGRVFTEVDARGRALVDFEMPDGNASYRAIKVKTSDFDLGVLRERAGMP